MADRLPMPVRYTVPEIATAYRVSRSTVRSWIASGELQAINVASPTATRPRLMVTPTAIEDFEKRRTIQKTAKRVRPPVVVKEFV